MKTHDRSSNPLAPSSELASMLAARVDLLSQMLTLIRLEGDLVFSAELTSPWALQFPPGSAHFYVVSEGEMMAQVGERPPVHARTGDLLMLPHGTGHILGDGAGAPAKPASELMTEQFSNEKLALRHGGNGPVTKLLAGAFHFERTSVPWVLSGLPAVIHLSKDSGDTSGWAEGLAHFMMVEAEDVHPGSSLMISRLIDVLVIRILRSWSHSAKASDSGWLGALSDARISRALKSIHDQPFRRWSVADLAGIAGMSRSSFAERFSTLVKEPPLSYQSRWRLTLAFEALRHADARVSEVARQVGYESDAAFSRAFKAQFGISPVQARAASRTGLE